MRQQSLLWLAAWTLTCGAAASAAQPEPPRELPEKPPPTAAAPAPAVPFAPGPGPTCPGVKVLWLEQQVPVRVLVPREVITEVRRPTLEVAYREEKRVVTEFVLKPREVLREVPFTTMQPCTVTDPHTGHCSTVLKPFTEMPTQKDVVSYPAADQREVLVQVPYLRQVQEIVPRRDILLEYRTDMTRAGMAVPITYDTPTPQVLVAPEACPVPHDHP